MTAAANAIAAAATRILATTPLPILTRA
jgi:hypothetical protein